MDFDGHAAVIEYRKMGLGVFSSTSPEDEEVAERIVTAVLKGIKAAGVFFDDLAARAAGGANLNVTNNSPWLFSRYSYLRDQFRAKLVSIKENSLYKVEKTTAPLPRGLLVEHFNISFSDSQEARWLGIAAIEAFFSWTEHVLIHIAILLGKLKTGGEVARMADEEWAEKVKAAIDLSTDAEMKKIYEELLDVRRQVRNSIYGHCFLYAAPSEECGRMVL